MNTTPKPPGTFIKEEMSARGWTQEDLARILQRPLPTINRILNGKHAILPEMAIALAAAFDNTPQLWMSRETDYRLSLADPVDTGVSQRAKLYELAPIKEMQKRGWIKQTDDAGTLELELREFFGVSTLTDDSLSLSGATRRTNINDPITASQRAWCHRVRHLAKGMLVSEFREDRIESCKKSLRKIAAYPQEAHKVSKALSEYGIRFVVVEPLVGAKVDGIAMWLDDNSPVIGMSMRYDRIDSFWHTLCHELSHIIHRDEAPLDTDLTDQMEGVEMVKSEMELRADREAADILVPSAEMDSFVLRVGPLYSKDRIIQFAHRVKMHPGIIVGQLQHRHEIGYHANREMLSKIRQVVTAAAFTDGWGNTIDVRGKE